MRMNIRLLLSVPVLILSVLLLTSSTFAERGATIYVHEGIEYRALPVEGRTPAAATKAEIAASELDQIMTNERVQALKIADYHKEEFGGVYVNENGNNVYLLTQQSIGLEQEIRNINPDAIIKRVKFSDQDLERVNAKLLDRKDLGIQFVIKKTMTNYVEVLISKEHYDKNKEDILQGIDPEAVEFIFGEFEFVDQASTIYPGGEIHKKLSGNNYLPCAIAFNASTSSNSKVAVTAGHCGNGTYHKLVDGTASIGSMSNATTSGIDAGFIKLGSSVNVSHQLQDFFRTIGTFDWNGAGHTVGNLTNLHAPSFGGVPCTGSIQNSSYTEPSLGLTDAVLVTPVGSVGGDSGGLWHRVTTKNGNSYAVIEGVHKGVLLDKITGQEVYSIYS